jgi:hypothetical protein
MGLCSPSEYSHTSSSRSNTRQAELHGSSPEVWSPTAYPRTEQRRMWIARACLTRAPCAFRFSQPPGALHRPVPAGPVSCQIRSWGSPFRALLLSRSRTPSPGRCPLDVGRQPGKRHRPDHERTEPKLNTSRNDQSVTLPEATSPSRLCSTRESATEADGLGRVSARSSPGFLPLQGVHPRWTEAAFTTSPLMRLPSQAQAQEKTLSRVSIPDEIGWSPKRLPTLLGFATS